MKLAPYQQQMANFILQGGDISRLSAVCKGYQEDELRARLSIYRNNTYYSLTEALKDLYPSVVETIGDGMFGVIARDFVETHPPASAAMVDYGHGFPTFLAGQSCCNDFSYLPDLAKLDLCYHKSFHAADDAAIAADVFASLAIEALAGARLEPLDSVYLLRSNYAIFTIWQLAQGLIDCDVNADQAQFVLVIRPQTRVYVHEIDLGIYTFLYHVAARQKTIDEALSKAAEDVDEFDPSGAISFLIQSGFAAKLIGEK